jgi:integrase
MAKTLTAIAVANARPGAKRYEKPDGGCPGLYLVVQSSGAKSWCTRFRFRGAQRKLTLGPFLAGNGQEPNAEPELDTPLSLAAARVLATKALRQAKGGIDPTAEKRKHRVALRTAEPDTLAAISEEYLRREGSRLRTLPQRRSDLELLYSDLGRQPVDQIRRGQYTRVLDRIADERGPVRADRALAALKRLLSWHAERSDFISPLGRGGRRVKPEDLARGRVLTDDELRRLWTAAETYPNPWGGYLRFTLLTACRRSESAGLRRGELSDDGREWTIPWQRYKTGYKKKRDVLIPLSKAAQQIIAAQPVLGGDYVFSADGTRPLGGFDKRKTDFDKVSGISDYRLHDLRRTARTLLSRAKVETKTEEGKKISVSVSPDIAERCLGHAITGVRGVYDRFEYVDQKRDAFEALAQIVERIVRPAPVADMEAERRKRRQRR